MSFQRLKKCTKDSKPACGWIKNNVECTKFPCAITKGTDVKLVLIKMWNLS